jgi:hypothetical protein
LRATIAETAIFNENIKLYGKKSGLTDKPTEATALAPRVDTIIILIIITELIKNDSSIVGQANFTVVFIK